MASERDASQLQSVSPQFAEQVARLLGVSQDQVLQAVEIAGPLLIGALAEKAATPTGAQAVLDMVRDGGDSTTDALNAFERGEGHALVHRLFGDGANKVAATIHDATGFDVAPYLPALTPLLLSLLNQTVRRKQLDAAGLATWLDGEAKEFASSNSLLSQQVHIALEAGRQTAESAAKHRARFTDEEWTTLTDAPTLAGYAVMMASLSGPVGVTKEMVALTDAMAATAHQLPGDSLVSLVSHEFKDPEPINALGVNRENAAPLALDACARAVLVLNDKATVQEQYEYKQFVMNVARQVARAAKEGTFLGLGGTAINAPEQTMLDQLSNALGFKP